MPNAAMRERLAIMDEQNTFQKIRSIINASELDEGAKREFVEVFAQTREAALAPVLKLLESDALWVVKLYENYRMKKDAVVTGNMAAWHDVLAQERAELEKVGK